MPATLSDNIGISAISILEPSWILGNDWFPGIARKFVHHTGIESRPISADDEVTMAVQAVNKLRREMACDLRDCAALVFVSPSFVPPNVAKELLTPAAARRECLRRAAKQVARRLGLVKVPVLGMNWFCSGYAQALAAVRRRMARGLKLKRNQFVLVVTASRISRITNYACNQTAPLFGDMATVTLLAPLDSRKYPVHFKLVHAHAEKQAARGVFFGFQMRPNLPLPTPDGGTQHEEQRLVFSLDGMGIADAAPRAMSSAVAQALQHKQLPPSEVRFVVPHQAGTGIVRFTGMKLEELGIRGELINGITGRVGNLSSCSIPYALHHSWNRLSGLVACPTAAVGDPGCAEVSQGCILLETTPLHAAAARAA
jgi:3-oxoacyl-[acyl-carrier-protein] synthase III